MGNIAQFPALNRQPPPRLALRGGVTGRPREVAALPATGGKRGEYALADVARPLGLLDRAPRTIIATLRQLAKHDGMPLPRTPRFVAGAMITGPDTIVKSSKWDAGEFDAWLDGRGPVSPAPAVPTPIREEMRLRAVQIGAAR